MARKRKAAPVAMAAAAQEMPITFDTGLYARLSVLDNGKTDGDPIESQVKIIEQYLSEHPELKLVDRYLDNGYSGVSFERPQWERLMQDVKAGKINCIIVKDLSRLGRNYIETGNFLERICPKLGIRFISVNDSYDTQNIRSQDELTVSIKNTTALRWKILTGRTAWPTRASPLEISEKSSWSICTEARNCPAVPSLNLSMTD